VQVLQAHQTPPFLVLALVDLPHQALALLALAPAPVLVLDQAVQLLALVLPQLRQCLIWTPAHLHPVVPVLPQVDLPQALVLQVLPCLAWIPAQLAPVRALPWVLVQDLLHLQVQAPALIMATAAVFRHQSCQLAPAYLLAAHQHSLVLPRNCPSLVVSFQPLLDFVVFWLSFCDGFNGCGLSTLVIGIGYRYLWFAFILHISLPSLPLIGR
jgi:hypothetical protein